MSAGSDSWTPTAATLEWRVVSDVALDPNNELFRMVMSQAAGVELHSVLILPSEVETLTPGDAYPSGFRPFALGQLYPEGAGLHPEMLNRLYRNAAAVARDRRQCVWSYVQTSNTKNTAYRPPQYQRLS